MRNESRLGSAWEETVSTSFVLSTVTLPGPGEELLQMIGIVLLLLLQPAWIDDGCEESWTRWTNKARGSVSRMACQEMHL